MHRSVFATEQASFEMAQRRMCITCDDCNCDSNQSKHIIEAKTTDKKKMHKEKKHEAISHKFWICDNDYMCQLNHLNVTTKHHALALQSRRNQ